MTETGDDTVRARLEAAALDARKGRDRTTLSALRSTVSALDNAEAVPVESADATGALENAPAGVGATEAERRLLGEDQQRDIVRAEILERRQVADDLDSLNHEAAQELRKAADLLEGLLA